MEKFVLIPPNVAVWLTVILSKDALPIAWFPAKVTLPSTRRSLTLTLPLTSSSSVKSKTPPFSPMPI